MYESWFIVYLICNIASMVLLKYVEIFLYFQKQHGEYNLHQNFDSDVKSDENAIVSIFISGFLDYIKDPVLTRIFHRML